MTRSQRFPKSINSVIILILLPVSWLAAVSYLIHEKNAGIQRYLQEQTAIQETAWKATTNLHKVGMKAYFEAYIMTPAILDILAYHRHEPKRMQVSRTRLYEELLPLYEQVLSEQDIQQLHFHTKHGNSFLRFHFPSRYGDPLAHIRPSIRIANSRLEPVQGYEVGRVVSGFRNVFPIITPEGEHLGSVELSQPIEAFRTAMAELDEIREYTFLINGPLLMPMLFEEQKSLYEASPIHPDWYYEDPHRTLPHAPPPMSNTAEILAATMGKHDNTFQIIENGLSGSVDLRLGRHYYVGTLTAIPDIEDKVAAYLVSFAAAPELDAINYRFLVDVSLSVIFVLALGWTVLGLIRARNASEAASKAKSGFLANMSHEIRTPMSGIMGSMQILASRISEPESSRIIAMTLDSARSLQQIIDDVLDLSKVEAGKLKLINRVFSPLTLLQKVKDLYYFQAREKGLELKIEASPDLPDYLWGDSYRLEQILRNLVNNAIKFTHSGEVVIGAKPLKLMTEKVRIRFEVRDTGIGISHEFMPHLFDNFAQADITYAKKFQGTGLGLSICKELTKIMGGDIFAESKPGLGSSFSVILTLPVAQAPETDENTSAESMTALPFSAPKLKILVAEDVKINQEYINFVLKRAGHSTVLTSSGKEALEAFQKEPFDIILMDIQMPEMDGLAATEAIRRLETDSDPTPTIALTAYAMAEDRKKFLQSGMDGYISKPIDPDLLLNEIVRLARPETKASGVSEKSIGNSPEARDSSRNKLLNASPKTLNSETQDDTKMKTKPQIKSEINGSRPEATQKDKKNNLFQKSQPPVSAQCIEERYGENDDLWQMMMDSFVETEIPEYMEELKKHAAQNDIEATFRTAHKIKGALGTLCAEKGAAKAAALDHAARNEQHNKIPQALDELLKELQNIKDYYTGISK
ncbi:hybrid sensor histidine kinase/response regulator [Desulfonatronovibrio magnus]|uniref:hybrid sensor histidine kinase/response regulator n=1 Tax=Desulfonatronovibrio magnus TaxID=698827 RepID=UPI000695C663|nr:response regulator [Desulfonatronovibrio magnus]